jgi:hypothetical protein
MSDQFDLAWVIDFRNRSDINNDTKMFLPTQWCKINHFDELILMGRDEAEISSFFIQQNYVNHIKNFWTVKNPKTINVFLIADDEDLLFASFFGYYLKQDISTFLNQINLPANTEFSCNLISYWDFSWNKSIELNKSNNLYALNFFQNIKSRQKRPFDFVFVCKDVNTGLQNFEYRHTDNDENYFNTKLIALIFHVSNKNQKIIRKKLDPNKWCVSFGATIIHFNPQTFYSNSAKELADQLVKELINSDNDPWDVEYNETIDSKLKSIEFNEVFKNITFREVDKNPIREKNSFFIPDLSTLWDWFKLRNLKYFFQEHTIPEILYKLKQSKVDFLFDSYNAIRTDIDVNYQKLINFKENNIKSPEVLFEEFFQHKPFSLQAYRKGLLLLLDEMQVRKQHNLDKYQKNYPNPDSQYCPTTMNPDVEIEYKKIVEEFNNKDTLVIEEKTKNQLLKLKEKAETIPHPISFLFKTTFLSSVIILLAYIPLRNLIENNWILYSTLSFLFVIPFLLNWNTYEKKVKNLNVLFCEFEALSKYFITRKLNDYLYRKIDSFFDEYINDCQIQINRVDNKIKEAEQFLQIKTESQKKALNIFSIRSAISLAENIPPVKILINGVEFESQIIKNDIRNLFQYFKQTIITSSNNLNSLLNNKWSFLLDLIVEQLKSSKDSITSASDLLFNNDGANIKLIEKESILNLQPPYNNGMQNVDNIYRDVIVDTTKNDKETEIIKFLQNDLSIDVTCFTSELSQSNEDELSTGAISILDINQPNKNVYDLFTTSLGGNKNSFVYHCQRFYLERKEDFLNIRNKIIRQEIKEDKNATFNIATNDANNLLFKNAMVGYDLNFDEQAWQMDIFQNTDEDYNNEINPFVSEIRKEFKIQFEESVRLQLNNALD